jgi:hypothetical protein
MSAQAARKLPILVSVGLGFRPVDAYFKVESRVQAQKGRGRGGKQRRPVGASWILPHWSVADKPC